MQSLFAQRLCNDMLGATETVIKQGLDHTNPIYRFAGAYAVGKKKLALEKELIDLLYDPDVYVQQMARRSLVDLSKELGVQDFGPIPGCTCKQIDESVQLWNDWWSNARKKSKTSSGD